MIMLDPKPLHPLSSGVVLIVGGKASNFNDEIKNHPRVIMWDSQNEHWLTKDLPSNTRAVFMTRWIGHDAFNNILKEARKRQITIFNPLGTGMIAKQVKELLALNKPVIETEKETEQVTPQPKVDKRKLGKLKSMIPLIDFNKSNIENARVLLVKAEEQGIKTTLGSLAQMVSKQRTKLGLKSPRTRQVSPSGYQTLAKSDVSIEMFDNLIKELKDMRALFVDTMFENRKLKQRLDRFKRFINE